jgi:hypothetical protein
MLGYPGSGNFRTNAPPPLANGNSLRSSEPSTEDLPAFDMWGNLAHIPSKDPEVPHSYFSKADPPPPSAALNPVPHSGFPGVGSLLGAATAGFLGRVGGGDALDPAIPRPAPASGAAGLVARLTNFWSTSGSPPRAAPPQRTFSPEPSLGSATTSVDRSVNSVSRWDFHPFAHWCLPGLSCCACDAGFCSLVRRLHVLYLVHALGPRSGHLPALASVE